MHGSPKPIGLIDSPSGGNASRFPGEWAVGVMDELFQNCDHLRPAPARHWSESQYVGQPDTVDGESDSGGDPWGNAVPVEPGLPIGIAFTQGLQCLGAISVDTGDILLAVSFCAVGHVGSLVVAGEPLVDADAGRAVPHFQVVLPRDGIAMSGKRNGIDPMHTSGGDQTADASSRQPRYRSAQEGL